MAWDHVAAFAVAMALCAAVQVYADWSARKEDKETE